MLILNAYTSCRVEEVGYTVPTDVQQQALPLLFSGHDCILHAQVITWFSSDIILTRFSVSLIQIISLFWDIIYYWYRWEKDLEAYQLIHASLMSFLSSLTRIVTIYFLDAYHCPKKLKNALKDSVSFLFIYFQLLSCLNFVQWTNICLAVGGPAST